MIPLPAAVQGLASEQLQDVATRISTFVIQTLGIAAAATIVKGIWIRKKSPDESPEYLTASMMPGYNGHQYSQM